MTYRVGNHWGVTIVREGAKLTDAERDDCAFCCTGGTTCPLHPTEPDQLVAVVVNGDQALAERICALLNADDIPEPYRPPHPTCVEVTQITQLPRREWICGARCPTPKEHAHGPHCDGTCRTDPLANCPTLIDSCTCTIAGPDPACPVHHGRRAKGPKPPNPPGCICDGSGRTCPRHGAVL